MVKKLNHTGRSGTKYKFGCLALFATTLLAVYFISIQPLQNPLDMLMNFHQSFNSGHGDPRNFLCHTARKSISCERPKNISDLAAAFKESGAVPPGEREDSFWHRREGVRDDSGDYVIYLARTIGGWKICYISRAG